MLLSLVSFAFAVRLTEGDFRRMLREVAPRVEAAAGRSLVELPELVLDEPEYIGAELEREIARRNGTLAAEDSARVQATLDRAIALYSPSSRRIFVNIPRVRTLLERAEARRTDPIPQAEAVLAHELAHALQHQYAGTSDAAAALVLQEGHATWVAERALTGAAREQARLEGGIHRLADPEVPADQRPYVFGHAAVSTLHDALGPEAVWTLLRTPPALKILEGLAAGQRRPAWPPPDFPAALGLGFDEPEVAQTGAWELAAALMDDYRVQRVRDAGPALMAKWEARPMRAEAAVLLFDNPEAASEVLAFRTGSVGRSQFYLLFDPGSLRSIRVLRSVAGLKKGPDFEEGMTVEVATYGTPPYREAWIRWGAELRVLATQGLTAPTLRAALAAVARMPPTGRPPGATAPEAAAALSALGAVAPVPPKEVSSEWAVLVVEVSVRKGSTCAAATAEWRARVVPVEAELLDRFEAAGCRFN
jgi:hypothetical protein